MNLTATAENGRARIELKGTISKWRETEAEFTSKVEQLIKSGIKDVHIYINSPGGECFEANEIVNVIKRFPGKITGEGGALVASAATYVAINCTSFSMPANGLFMIHQVSGGACGKVADIESTLEVMRKLNDHYLNAFLSKCTDKKKIKDAWDKGDYWMSAQEAKENMEREPEKTFYFAFSGGSTPSLMFDIWANEYKDCLLYTSFCQDVELQCTKLSSQ